MCVAIRNFQWYHLSLENCVCFFLFLIYKFWATIYLINMELHLHLFPINVDGIILKEFLFRKIWSINMWAIWEWNAFAFNSKLISIEGLQFEINSWKNEFESLRNFFGAVICLGYRWVSLISVWNQFSNCFSLTFEHFHFSLIAKKCDEHTSCVDYCKDKYKKARGWCTPILRCQCLWKIHIQTKSYK